MDVQDKTRQELIQELEALRRRVAALEAGNGRSDAAQPRSAEWDVLRDTRQLCEAILHLSPAAIVVTTEAEGRVLAVSEAVERVTGYSQDEMLGHTVLELDLWGSAADRRRMLQILDDQGVVRDLEMRGRGRSGETRVGLLSSSRVTVGEERRLLTLITDVTERREAEETIRVTQEFLTTLIEDSPAAIYVISADFTYRLVNRAWEELTGVPREQAIGRRVEDLFPAETVREFCATIRQVMEEGAHLVFDGFVQTPRGQRYGHMVKFPVRDTAGRIEAVGGITVDLTDRREAKEALQASEERFRLLAEHAQDVIYRFRLAPTPSFEYISPGTLNVTGYAPQDFYDDPELAFKIVHPDDRALLRSLLQPSGLEQKQYAIRWISKDGRTVWTEQRRSHVYDAAGNLVAIEGVARDVTERKRAEELLRLSVEKTTHTQRTLLALSQAARAVQRARTPGEVYRAVEREVAGLGYDTAVLTLTQDRKHLAVAYATNMPASFKEAESLLRHAVREVLVPLEPRGVFQRVIADGQAAYVSAVEDLVAEALPERLRPLANGLTSYLLAWAGAHCILAPLPVAGQIASLLMVAGPDLTEDDVPAIAAFAHQAAVALENARLLEAVERHAGELRRLSTELVAAQETERGRISRELHDELGQVLTMVGINPATVEKTLPAEFLFAIREKWTETRALVDLTLERVRELSLDLRPPMLDDLGLVPTLRWYTARFAERLNVNVKFKAVGFEQPAPPEVATVLYRVVQESLTNVAKHAAARTVRVDVRRKASAVVARIWDDGQGFDPAEVARRDLSCRGMGLLGMHERVTALGGALVVLSRPGSGVQLRVTIPTK